VRRVSTTGQDICARIGRELAAAVGSSIIVHATDDGRVRLEGAVRSLADHSIALATARSTPGVRDVEDLLRIIV
jgi:osmotically-inducible protein OsmY